MPALAALFTAPRKPRKPRITLYNSAVKRAVWCCHMGLTWPGFGPTPQAAYNAWRTANDRS